MTSPEDPRAPEGSNSATGGEPTASTTAATASTTPSGEAPSSVAAPRPLGKRAKSAFGSGSWFRRFARLWGFLAFCILIVVLARHVILPFVFALLLAYILTPIVDRMSVRRSGKQRMPRGIAIVFCYLALIGFIVGFGALLLPRLSGDAARIGREAPKLYERMNNEWAPDLARWIERKFPSMAVHTDDKSVAPVVADVPVPPGTAFVVTPLPDGRLAVQLSPNGVHVAPRADGSFAVSVRDDEVEGDGLEDKIRAWAGKILIGLQAKSGDVVRAGQRFLSGMIRSVFTFFLVLMIAAFIMLDIPKLFGFARSLIPTASHADFDFILAGMNRGLSGVIRGQLIICVVNGVLTYIGLVVFDVKYAIILAMVATVMSLIPIFGSILSTIPIVFAALVSGEQGLDVARGVFITAWIVGIHFIEANLLNPKIIGSAAKIHPVLVVFSLIVGEHSYGLVGALLAVPVASMIQVLFLFFRDKSWKLDNRQSPPAGA